ncbi:MAG: PQQ-binding-like beta-propeller repeat protein [Thermoguttaceae bacterium]
MLNVPPTMRSYIFCFLVSAFLSFSSLVSISFADEWPVFNGKDGENRSSETGLLKEWPEAGPQLLWTCEEIGEGVSGYSSVTIADGRIYTSGNLNERSTVYCLNEKDGKIIWMYDNGPGWLDARVYAGTRSTPTIDEERVYDFSAHGQLVCLDAKTGEKKWEKNILKEYEAENILWGLAESVIIDGQKLICTPGGKKCSVVALDKLTGEQIWAAPSTGHKTSYCTPLIIEQDGLRILLTLDNNGLFGVNVETGELLFEVAHHNQEHATNADSPRYRDGLIFISNPVVSREEPAGAKLLKLTVDGQKANVEEVWHNWILDDLNSGTMMIGEHIYGSSYGYKAGTFLCVKLSDGEPEWENKSLGRCSLTYADGKLYLLAERGNDVYLLDPAPQECRIISQFKLPEKGEGNSWAHPVICDKKLYIRHGKFLFCYDIAEK